MGQSVETTTNAATPVADDFMKMLQGQITGGQIGSGFGPLQREAGTAIRQFVEGGGMTPGLERQTQKQALDLREGLGATGNRFGSAGQIGEAFLRAQSMGEASRNLLQGITAMQGMGQQNLMPFILASKMGMARPEHVVQPGPLDYIIDIAKTGGGVMGGIGAMKDAGMFGGGSAQ